MMFFSSSGGGSTTGVTASASLVGTTSKVEKRETIGQLLRNVLIPILRGEHIHLKEVTVQAIGFTNSHALKLVKWSTNLVCLSASELKFNAM